MAAAHWLHLYQKPAQGTSFLKRYQAFNYRHKISAVGGFDTAACELSVSRAEAEQFLEQYVGNRIAAYVDNPAAPIWEGLINRITFNYGSVEYTISLEEMANRATVFMPAQGTLTTAITAAANNTASQAIYGIIEKTLDAPPIGSSATGIRTILRDKYLSQYAYPQASMAFRGAGAITLRLEMLGFYHTLLWDNYTNTAITTANASVVLTEVIQDNANTTTFFDDTDTSLIAANATFTFSRQASTGVTRWQFCQGIQEAGDGVNEWIMGITPTDVNTGKRRFYYQQANNTVEYTAKLAEGLAVIRSLTGARVHPWDARPDRAIRVQDALIGWNFPGSDPRQIFIDTVDYDAERQLASFAGQDDIQLEGALKFKRQYKKRGKRWDSPARPLG